MREPPAARPSGTRTAGGKAPVNPTRTVPDAVDDQPGLTLIQELFPGRILSREPLAADGLEDSLAVESEGNEYPEADEGSPEGPGEDA